VAIAVTRARRLIAPRPTLHAGDRRHRGDLGVVVPVPCERLADPGKYRRESPRRGRRPGVGDGSHENLINSSRLDAFSRMAGVPGLASGAIATAAEESRDLAGTWRFRIDRDDLGLAENWANAPLAGEDTVQERAGNKFPI
jgi:hypothetical protein